ncbi:MAG TPA: BolA family protein [Gammaproteobacteria bacterium]|nr:BolA family protein [Gammaproteobacteria bacterium]
MPPTAPPELLETIRAKLEAALAPQSLEIIDDSARHAGHREAAGRFHLKVVVVAERFEGLPAVQRHRLVYDTLAEELSGPVHALNVDAQTP